MTEFAAKKLGEAIAFEKEGQRILEQSADALTPYLGELASLQQSLSSHESAGDDIAREQEVEKITMAKAEATGEKLQKLADIYIGDDWDDAAEVMEWLGFFEGAAVVHWRVVQGICEANDIPNLATVANQAVELHQQNLQKVSLALKTLAKERG